MCPPTGWMTRGTKTIFLCVPNNWVSLLIINQSSEQLPSADHVTTEQCHAVWRVTRDTGWYLVWPPRSVFIVHRIFTLLHKDTIYQLLAGLGWVVTRYTEHCVLNQVYARCPPSAQPRHTVCIGTRSQTPALPLTQEGEVVVVVVTRRQWQWPRHQDTHCPHGIWRQNALCPHCAAQELLFARHSDGSQAAVSLSAEWCKACVCTSAGAGCCRVRGRRNQTRDSPCAGLGWDPATDVNWGPNMGMPPGHPGPGHAAAATRAHVSPKQLSYFHVNHKILPNEMDDSTFS